MPLLVLEIPIQVKDAVGPAGLREGARASVANVLVARPVSATREQIYSAVDIAAIEVVRRAKVNVKTKTTIINAISSTRLGERARGADAFRTAGKRPPMRLYVLPRSPPM